MSYFESAFGTFNPQTDSDAAAKFILNIILMDDRLDELRRLITDGDELGGMEGEPGWNIERKDMSALDNNIGYENWPSGMNFHMYVDPASFELAFPEKFMTTDEFFGLVRLAITAFISKNLIRVEAAQRIIAQIS